MNVARSHDLPLWR